MTRLPVNTSLLIKEVDVEDAALLRDGSDCSRTSLPSNTGLFTLVEAEDRAVSKSRLLNSLCDSTNLGSFEYSSKTDVLALSMSWATRSLLYWEVWSSEPPILGIVYLQCVRGCQCLIIAIEGKGGDTIMPRTCDPLAKISG